MKVSNSTCRAALFHGPGTPLRLEELPLPSPEAYEALVRIDCCTICGSDLHTVTGARREATPSILGHEAVGYIEQLGSPAPVDLRGELLSVGDRVTWSTVVACGKCDRCLAGLPQKCRHLSKYGHEQAVGRQALSGGLAEFLLLRPGSAIVRIPEELPNEVISPVNCATATVAAMLRCAERLEQQRVLIFGAGMLGITAAAMCHAAGASRVVLVDTQLQRLELARRFGATDTIVWQGDEPALVAALTEQTGVARADVILEVSGAAPAVAASLNLAEIGARVVLAGSVMPSPAAPLDPEQVIRRCLTIRGMHNYAPVDLLTAVEFLREHSARYPFAELVSQSFPLSEINQALEFALNNRPIRLAIRP